MSNAYVPELWFVSLLWSAIILAVILVSAIVIQRNAFVRRCNRYQQALEMTQDHANALEKERDHAREAFVRLKRHEESRRQQEDQRRIEIDDLLTTPRETLSSMAEHALKAYLDGYEFDDGESANYVPTPRERVLIDDAVNGLLADDDWVKHYTAWRAVCVNFYDGAAQITIERFHQKLVKGYTPEHDAGHGIPDFIKAAQAYLLATVRGGSHPAALALWPWEPQGFKPRTAERNLVRAGALVAAALDLYAKKPIEDTL